MKPKLELLLPMWPDKYARSEKLGLGTRHPPTSGTDSFWLPLRARPADESTYLYADATRAWQDISIQVWVSRDYGIDLRVKAYEIYSAEVAFLEVILKNLKWANKRLEGIGKIDTQNLPFKLMEFCERLGIKQGVQYRFCKDDVFVPVAEVLTLIDAEIRTSFANLRSVEAA